ncbi:Uncharacterised protein [Legionella spiritensis]|nr:Uncharacterised protein [Legionella spiritensis]
MRKVYLPIPPQLVPRAKTATYVLRLVRRIQESRSVPGYLDPADKPQDVGICNLPQLIEKLRPPPKKNYQINYGCVIVNTP